MSELNFAHRFSAAPDTQNPHAQPTLLLLHGTGGDENSLISLGRSLAPNANLLSPRGKVSEQGAPRFFRRLAEGVFDEDDLRLRSAELATFISEAAVHYGFDAHNVIALGYSNGANIAAALLLLHPEVLRAAILLRAMVPLVPEKQPNLAGVPVLMASGESDPLVPVENAERLAQMLRGGGADVLLRWQAAGHGLENVELEAVQGWLAQLGS